MKESNVSKQRIIQEYVPGKQVTLAHIIANPSLSMLKKVGLLECENKSIGIMTITPSEAVIIVSDIVLKVSNVEIGFLDRFNGSIVMTGLVSDIEVAITESNDFLYNVMGFSTVDITRN